MGQRKITGAGEAPPEPKRRTRTDVLMALLREDGGKTAAELAEAVGWRVHSVRGFISGVRKKHPDLELVSIKADGGTRYSIRDGAAE